MIELISGHRFEVDSNSREPVKINFYNSTQKIVTPLDSGVTENELLSVLVRRLNHLYQEKGQPDILSALRKLKEANFLITPHVAVQSDAIE